MCECERQHDESPGHLCRWWMAASASIGSGPATWPSIPGLMSETTLGLYRGRPQRTALLPAGHQLRALHTEWQRLRDDTVAGFISLSSLSR